jgi:YaiO family outer membrane protein
MFAKVTAAALSVIALVQPSSAQRTIEMGASYNALSGIYSDQSSLFLRTTFAYPRYWWSAEGTYRRDFGDSGVTGALSAGRQVQRSMLLGSLGAATGNRALPGLTVYAEVRHPLTASLVGGVGWVHYDWSDGAHQNTLQGALIVYPSTRWIAEAGTRLTWGQPGDVFAPRYHVGATHGEHGRYYLTGRVSWGREAYQPQGFDNVLIDFYSTELLANSRIWVHANRGFALQMLVYKNPSYTRYGIGASAFRTF